MWRYRRIVESISFDVWEVTGKTIRGIHITRCIRIKRGANRGARENFSRVFTFREMRFSGALFALSTCTHCKSHPLFPSALTSEELLLKSGLRRRRSFRACLRVLVGVVPIRDRQTFIQRWISTEFLQSDHSFPHSTFAQIRKINIISETVSEHLNWNGQSILCTFTFEHLHGTVEWHVALKKIHVDRP